MRPNDIWDSGCAQASFLSFFILDSGGAASHDKLARENLYTSLADCMFKRENAKKKNSVWKETKTSECQ